MVDLDARGAIPLAASVSIFWGEQHLYFFNDAFGQSIGSERRVAAMGRPGVSVWPEIWDFIFPQIQQALSGTGATWHENDLVPIFRDGKVEDVYWTYSYSPIDAEDTATGVGGVLVLATQTTAQVLAERRAVTERERLAHRKLRVLIEPKIIPL